MKKLKGVIIGILLIVILALIGLFYVEENIAAISDIQDYQEITIEDNWYGKKVLSYLEEEGIIKNADIAYYYLRLKNIDMNIKAGTYQIDKSLSLEEIIAYLSDGKNAIQNTVSVKLLEGYRLKDYAVLIAESTNLEAEELLEYWNDTFAVEELCNDYQFLEDRPFSDDVKYLLEGYLFPDTYEFFAKTSAEEVTRKILDNTNYYYEKYKEDFENSKYSIHQIFSLASIIQRESGNVEEMKDISSVFYNRLDAGMQLQSSVTVCYALDIGVNEDWTKCEITQSEYDPYNTYQIIGFPPGPICSFNEYALAAALKPNNTDYYFFIGNVCGEGQTIFARTYQEQLENQARYLTCY